METRENKVRFKTLNVFEHLKSFWVLRTLEASRTIGWHLKFESPFFHKYSSWKCSNWNKRRRRLQAPQVSFLDSTRSRAELQNFLLIVALLLAGSLTLLCMGFEPMTYGSWDHRSSLWASRAWYPCSTWMLYPASRWVGCLQAPQALRRPRTRSRAEPPNLVR